MPLILLDSGVLGLLGTPFGGDRSARCKAWHRRIEDRRVLIRVPLICYYEVRREILRLVEQHRSDPGTRTPWRASLDWLDEFTTRTGFLRHDLKVMRLAAELWARSRSEGFPTAPDDAIDADLIIAATAQKAARGGRLVHVVTTNPGHLTRFVQACRWDEYPFN